MRQSALVKCTSTIRQLVYGSVSDSLDEYLQIGNKTAPACLVNYCNEIIELYGQEYFLKPTQIDIEKLYAYHEEKHGFPGMVGNIDYTKWPWALTKLSHGMSVVYVLSTPITEDGGDYVIGEQIRKRSKWENVPSTSGTDKDSNVEVHGKVVDQQLKLRKKAVNDEMDSIMGNDNWVLVDLPPGCKPLGCKWFLKRKMKVDGTVKKFKARYHNMLINQMDVKTTFLNGKLNEEVDMNQPQGFIMPGNERMCEN
ncbi:hypothetical protein Tco_1533910 [Tanacetum coccineum]